MDPALVEDLRYTQGAAGGYYTGLLRSDGTGGGPGARRGPDLTRVALEVTTPFCSGAAILPGDPAFVEDLAYTQVAAGGYHTVLLRSVGAAGAHPALVDDLIYTQVTLEVTTPS